MRDPLWPPASEWLSMGAEEPLFGVMGVPASMGSITPSEAWRAPTSLRQALDKLSTFDGERRLDLADLPVLDIGDIDVSTAALQPALEAIEQRARGLDRGAIWAFLGGDNSITRPLVNGLASHRPDEVGIVTFDAHHDVRVLDSGPGNGTPIRGLIEDGVPGDHIVQIGIHTFANSRPYRDYCDEHGIRVVTMADVEADGIGVVLDRVLGHLATRCAWIYVDFDLDVLDRSFAPGCPGSRPGGMTPRMLAAAAVRCGRHHAVKAADFVEVDPARDRDGITVYAMALAFLSFASGVASRFGVGS